MNRTLLVLMLWSTLALLPILNAIYVVVERGANRPFAEEWFDSSLAAIAAHDGTLSLDLLLTPQGDYTHLTTKLFVGLLTPLTRYDLRLDMLLGILLSTLTLLCLLYLMWRQDRRLAVLLAPFLSALLFTPRQADNWLNGFQNVYFAFVLCVTLIVLLIEVLPIGWRTLWLAALLTTFGAIGLGVAPFYWLTALVAFWLRGYRRKRYYAVWIALSALLTVHFLSYLATEISPSITLSRLGLIAHFAVAFLGAPLAPIMRLWIGTGLGVLGVLLFALNALLLWRWRPEWLRSWAALGVFGVLSALAAAYGRWIYFDGSSAYPLASRYVTNGIPFWAALLAIIASNLLLNWQEVPFSAEGLPKRILPFVSWLNRNIFTINSAALLILGIALSASFSTAQHRYLPDNKPVAKCLESLPITRDLDCAANLGAGRSNFLPVLVRTDQLAVRGLGIFAAKPVVPRFGEFAAPLEYIGSGTSLGQSPDSRFTTWEIGGERYKVFLQQPPALQDWTVWFHHITAPAYFEAALYVAPESAASSVTFRVYGQLLFQEQQLLFEQHYDPRQQSQPVPIRISLAPFLNQRSRLRLILETEGAPAQAMWLEPRFVLALTEEAARAPYYPPR
ncbi:MAG: hypothetical protein SNJ58_14150 [Aggregatilineales bacterium]